VLSSLIRDKSKRSINLWDFTFHDDKATIEKLGADPSSSREERDFRERFQREISERHFRERFQREISDVYLEHKAPRVTHPNDEKKR